MQRRLMAAMVIAAVTATSVGSYLIGSRVASPAEVAARTAAPLPSPILVPVEERVLSTRVVTRGTGRFGSPQRISLTASMLKPAVGVLAALPASGAPLAEGAIVARASGRPVFVLVGDRPTARDLGVGMSGEDVRQLEAALARLGHDPGLVDGAYDDATAAAVASWYTTNGFAPFTATAEQESALRARELERTTASIERLAADETVAPAAAAVVAARVAAAAATGRAEVTARNVDRARGEAAAAMVVADAEVATRTDARDRARAGTPASPAPASAGEIAVTERELAVAIANRDAIRVGGDRSIDEAVAAASEAAGDAMAKQAALEAAGSTETMAQRIASARGEALERATEEVERARLRSGVQVPADEVVFVAAAPVRVAELLVGVGDPASGKLMTVTDAVVHVDGGLAVEDANLVKQGMSVEIAEPDLGLAAGGVVASVATGPGTNGADGFHVWFQVDVTQPPANLVGASVRLTIPVASTGRVALTVPVSALTLAADGSSRVERSSGTGSEMVSVTPGLAADGFVAVTEVPGSLAPLKAGDLVVVGVAGTSTATPDPPTAALASPGPVTTGTSG